MVLLLFLLFYFSSSIKQQKKEAEFMLHLNSSFVVEYRGIDVVQLNHGFK